MHIQLRFGRSQQALQVVQVLLNLSALVSHAPGTVIRNWQAYAHCAQARLHSSPWLPDHQDGFRKYSSCRGSPEEGGVLGGKLRLAASYIQQVDTVPNQLAATGAVQIGALP